MRALALFGKGYQLFIISALEIGTPFARMLILTHSLSLQELGFASALAASYGMFEQVTHFAIYRFVFSTPRDQYQSALSGAHGLSVVRGLVVGALAVAAAPLLASLLSVPTEWPSFALLGAIIAIKALENLAPRVAERDYQYGGQLAVTSVSSGLSLMALIGWAHWWHADHTALLASLAGQMTGMVVTSHLVAKTPYRPKFRTPQFVAAFKFGYPLAFNGLGLALTNQADRLVVGALLGLSNLGIYSIVLLVTTVPLMMVSRFTSTISLSALHNSAHRPAVFTARLRLAGSVFPLIFAVYSIGILTMMNIVTPRVFGHQFEVSKSALLILSVGAFIRLARGDPFASLLLHAGRTKRLAFGNIIAMVSLLFIGLFAYYFKTTESAYFGRLIGETISLAVTMYVSRHLFAVARSDHATSMLIGFIVIALVGAACVTTTVGTAIVPSLVILALSFIVLVAVGARLAAPVAKAAFSTGLGGDAGSFLTDPVS